MSTDRLPGTPLPRTAVPLGITDPVEKARAELKAALAAIEEKSNVPKRLAIASEHGYADISHTLEIFGTCPACR